MGILSRKSPIEKIASSVLKNWESRLNPKTQDQEWLFNSAMGSIENDQELAKEEKDDKFAKWYLIESEYAKQNTERAMLFSAINIHLIPNSSSIFYKAKRSTSKQDLQELRKIYSSSFEIKYELYKKVLELKKQAPKFAIS